MSEHKIIYIISDCKVFGELIERLVLSLEYIFLVTRKPVALRPTVAQTERNPRVQKAEEELQDAIMKGSAQKAVSQRDRAQPIAVTEAESLAFDLHYGRLLKALHAQFLKVAVCPHIVIPLKETHLHSPVHKLLKSGKDADITLWNDITVFIPEIPYVSEQIQGLRLLRQGTEEVRETAFSVCGIGNLKTEMYVGDEICASVCHYAKMNMARAARTQ